MVNHVRRPGVLLCAGAAIFSGCAGPNGPQRTATVGAIRIEADGLAAEWAPGIDRCVMFGPTASSNGEGLVNMLYTRSLEIPPAADGSYTFRGGCYTWVAPQNGPLGWKSPEGADQNWPPDPTMDIGPTRVTGRSSNSITTAGPRQRSGLVERQSFTLRDGLSAELRLRLRNEGDEPRLAGAWVTTAVGEGDVIALRMPEGTVLRGWDDASVQKLTSIVSPPGSSGWVTVDLSKADWEGGVKVYIEAPAHDTMRSQIAVWRSGYWFVRTGAAMDEQTVRRLREVDEGPVAVYIQPGRGRGGGGGGGTDGIIEAELFGPIEEIPPGGEIEVTEEWRLIPASVRGDISALPEVVRKE